MSGYFINYYPADSVGGNTLHNNYYFCGNKVIIITKYAIKADNIMQVTLLTNVTRYLSNEVTVTSIILCNIITTSNEGTNFVTNLLSNT